MTYAIAEPIGEPADDGETAADRAELARAVALRAHQARVEIGEQQLIDPSGTVLCLWCLDPIDAPRLAAIPRALRHTDCQVDYEQFQRRNA